MKLAESDYRQTLDVEHSSMPSHSGTDSLSISAKEYLEFSTFLRESCGINLGDNKQYLVATRVRRILKEKGLADLNALNALILHGRDLALQQRVIDAMTTNETFWFRDNYPFDYLHSQLLPELTTKPKKTGLRVWSAACSTGQEPYSISMVYQDFLQRNPGRTIPTLDILATDVCSEALEVAKKGTYDHFSVLRGLSDERIRQFFNVERDDVWRVNPDIARRIRFRPLNLQTPFVLLGKFDVIFCRNVLIYFTADLKREILSKLHGALNPGGYLFLGSSESITGVADLFQVVHCQPGVVYKAKERKPIL